MTHNLEEVLDVLYAEGLSPEDPEFEVRKKELLVLACQERRGVENCSECGIFLFCELRLKYRQLKHAQMEE